MKYHNKTQSILDALADEERIHYMDKIKKYRSECGCSMGGVFTTIAIILYGIYINSVFKNFSPFIAINVIFIGFFTITIAGLLGKITGISVARIKLLLLIRSTIA